jgi:hypothetical protein
MERISFDIYIPDQKKFHLTPDWIVFGLWFIVIGFFWALDGVLPDSGYYRGFAALMVAIVSIYYLITSFWTYKPLNGKLEGQIVINQDSFIINNTAYSLKDIYNLDFLIYDYYGKSSTIGRSFSPRLYQGVNNYISFTDKNNEDHLVYFKLQTEHSFQSLAPFINRAIKLNRMSTSRGIELMGIENISIN